MNVPSSETQGREEINRARGVTAGLQVRRKERASSSSTSSTDVNAQSPFLHYILELINYSYSSYPTRETYSGQVDGFGNPMKNQLKTRQESK